MCGLSHFVGRGPPSDIRRWWVLAGVRPEVKVTVAVPFEAHFAPVALVGELGSLGKSQFVWGWVLISAFYMSRLRGSIQFQLRDRTW